MSKPPSLQDVARTALLSPATVSRYLNGSLTLPKDTADRIDAAIAKHNYRPNPHARSLSRGKSDTIGLVVPDIANPFFAKLAASVERYADEAGLALMLCSSINRQDRELDYIERLRRNYVDGLLFTTNHRDQNHALARAINQSANIVLLDEDVEDTDVPKVFSDNVQGGGLAATHLLEAGHRKLAFIGGAQNIMSSRERALGFGQVVGKSEAVVEAQLYGAYTKAFGQQAMATLLDTYPNVSAIFVASDEILFGMLDTLRQRNLRVGTDISIITYDDVGPLAFFDPPVTAVRQSIEAIGKTGFELLRRRMDGDASVMTHRIPVELIVRQSVRNMN